ncbi:LacI family DNA-binding transcriptional regulator [Dictyobacter kobayashii]|uniref:LacI family transcriptional regulator n=1 Tax=Dictyobacter kobayashii TaxID=2014872 RepID=A0A402AVA0_9CHLR|nr:LacI family DNA-binding transcriptional regulator [Dictyobacter kobayashii]GCE22933.1 LacI family transcriptional regulator [Dictyobacter kobayashii]
MVTSEQVARLAGVSRATVSRVLNGSPNVSEETKKRIYAAIATLGYGTNIFTKAVPQDRSRMIALAMFDGEGGLNFSQLAMTQCHFYLELLRFIEQAVAEAGYDLFLPARPYSTFDAGGDPTLNYVLSLQARGVEGVITLALGTDDPRIQGLCNSSMPAVFIDNLFQGSHATYAKSDYKGGAVQAAEHLLQLGHRRIAFFPGSLFSITGTERFMGHQQAMASAGLSIEQQLVCQSGWETQDAYHAALALLRERRDFTAIVANSDMIAFGILRALKEHHIRVPEDVSVIGFDDIDRSQHSDPPLTTISQDKQAIGQGAVSRLLQLMSGEEAPSPLVVPTKLIVRASTSTVKRL